MEGVNTGIEIERFYIRIKRVEKIISEPFRLMLIKFETFDQIFLSRIKELNSHFI